MAERFQPAGTQWGLPRKIPQRGAERWESLFCWLAARLLDGQEATHSLAQDAPQVLGFAGSLRRKQGTCHLVKTVALESEEKSGPSRLQNSPPLCPV